MAAERHALESSVIEMNTHGAQIERWLRDNESKTPTGQRPRLLCCLYDVLWHRTCTLGRLCQPNFAGHHQLPR